MKFTQRRLYSPSLLHVSRRECKIAAKSVMKLDPRRITKISHCSHRLDGEHVNNNDSNTIAKHLTLFWSNKQDEPFTNTY